MTEETVITVEIYTGYLHAEGDKSEEYRQQIVKTQLCLESFFNFIKLSAGALEEQTENRALAEYCADLQHISEVGKGLTVSISDAVDKLIWLQKEARNEKED